MAPKKQNKSNAYSVYVKETHQLHGVTYAEGFAFLRQNWKNLSAEEREAYNCKAKQLNGNRNKLTNAGCTYEELEEQALMEKRKIEAAQRWIDRKVNGRDGRKTLADLAETSFFVIHFNKHTVTHDGQVIPAEMGLVRFSLKYGIEEERTCVIQNAKKDLPLGYAYKMRERALTTHAIPVEEDFPLAKSPKSVVNNIISFLNEENLMQRHNSDIIELSPVFTLESKVERVDHTIEEEIKDGQKVLDNLFKNADETINPPYIYDINDLFCAMWRAWIRHGGHSLLPESMLQTALQTKLEEDRFVYECCSPDCCDFHAALENKVEQFMAKYCSLCICKRYIYTICSYLTTQISNTECIPGHHKPLPEEIYWMKKILDEDDKLQHALKMAVLKEYKNPISGVDLPRGGSMNGTTFLPKDKDPAIEIKEQMKLKMESLRLDESKRDDEKDVNLDIPPGLSSDNEGSLIKEGAEGSVKSDNSGSRPRKNISRRLWARFDQEPSDKSNTNARNNSTTFYSY